MDLQLCSAVICLFGSLAWFHVAFTLLMTIINRIRIWPSRLWPIWEAQRSRISVFRIFCRCRVSARPFLPIAIHITAVCCWILLCELTKSFFDLDESSVSIINVRLKGDLPSTLLKFWEVPDGWWLRSFRPFYEEKTTPFAQLVHQTLIMYLFSLWLLPVGKSMAGVFKSNRIIPIYGLWPTAESRKSDGSTAVSRRKVLLINVIFEDSRKV